MRVLNIVDRVNFLDVSNDQENRSCTLPVFPDERTRSSIRRLKQRWLFTELDLVRTGKLVLFELEAVCGAACILLAKSVVLEPLDAVRFHT